MEVSTASPIISTITSNRGCAHAFLSNPPSKLASASLLKLDEDENVLMIGSPINISHENPLDLLNAENLFETISLRMIENDPG